MAGKDDKVYEQNEVVLTLNKGSRRELRDFVVKKFLEEKEGYWQDGVKHVTLYKYYVEDLSNGKKIYLLRPTYLNKGIDFQVWVEKFDGIEDQRPSHKDIFNDLMEKKKEDGEKLKNLIKLIERVWNCEDPNSALKSNKITFKVGLSVEMLLKILKWLFIEQDITYWNYDGRGMLWQAINKISEQSVL